MGGERNSVHKVQTWDAGCSLPRSPLLFFSPSDSLRKETESWSFNNRFHTALLGEIFPSAAYFRPSSPCLFPHIVYIGTGGSGSKFYTHTRQVLYHWVPFLLILKRSPSMWPRLNFNLGSSCFSLLSRSYCSPVPPDLIRCLFAWSIFTFVHNKDLTTTDFWGQQIWICPQPHVPLQFPAQFLSYSVSQITICWYQQITW